ncbi:MAG TPA: hypothetical protein VKT51_08830 [Candidatus Eremiobacteraceae bacterium]|nr:hypothetical protein [Candidatus Eremiobacteraceae bacterium]
MSLTPSIWKTLRDGNVVPPLKRIPGTKTYGMTASDERRLIKLLTVKAQLKGRFRLGALALELAIIGDRDIPWELVRTELRTRLSHFFGLVHRALIRQTHLPGSKSYTLEDIKRSAKSLSRKMLKGVRTEPRYLDWRESLETLLVAILGQIYLQLDPHELELDLQSALQAFLVLYDRERGRLGMTRSEIATVARAVVFMLRPMIPWFTRDESQNSLFNAVVRATHDDLQSALRIGPSLNETLRLGLDQVRRALSDAKVTKLNSIVLSEDFRGLLKVFILVTILESRSNPNALPVLNELRGGSSPTALSILSNLAGMLTSMTKAERLRHDRASATNAKGKRNPRRRRIRRRNQS